MGRSARLAVLLVVGLLLAAVVIQPRLFRGEDEGSSRGLPKADKAAAKAATAPAFPSPTATPAPSKSDDAARAEKLSEQLDANPRDVGAWKELGAILVRQQDFLRAAEAYSAAVEVAPDDATAHAQLGRALLFQGLVRLGRGELQRALALDSNQADAHLYLGITYSHAAPNDIPAARAAWNKTIALSPDSEFAKQAKQFLTTYATASATPTPAAAR